MATRRVRLEVHVPLHAWRPAQIVVRLQRHVGPSQRHTTEEHVLLWSRRNVLVRLARVLRKVDTGTCTSPERVALSTQTLSTGALNRVLSLLDSGVEHTALTSHSETPCITVRASETGDKNTNNYFQHRGARGRRVRGGRVRGGRVIRGGR